MKTYLLAAAALSALVATPALARSETHVSFGFYTPAPVAYYPPPPVFYAPPPPRFVPAPVAFYGPPPCPKRGGYYRHGPGRGHAHGHWRRGYDTAWKDDNYGYWDRGRPWR